MIWQEETHGTDKGYRSPTAYVGRTPGGFWRIWALGSQGWKLTENIFASDKEARNYADHVRTS